jgi:hypothetical protein
MVTRVDQLARSIRDLQEIVREQRERGVTLKATEQPLDTRTASGEAFLDTLECGGTLVPLACRRPWGWGPRHPGSAAASSVPWEASRRGSDAVAPWVRIEPPADDLAAAPYIQFV